MEQPSKAPRHPADDLRLALPSAAGDPIQDHFPLRNLQRLLLHLLRIHRKLVRRQHPQRQMETRPSPPGSDLPPLAADPRRQMLEMTHRISDESPVPAVPQHPDQHRIRRRPGLQDPRLIAKVRHEGLVELEDRLRRFPFPPKRLRVAKAGVIVGHILHRQIPRHRGTVRLGHHRQQRAGGKGKAFQDPGFTTRIHACHPIQSNSLYPSRNPISFVVKALQLAGR